MTPPMGAQLTARDYVQIRSADERARHAAEAAWCAAVETQCALLEQSQGANLGAADELARLLDWGEREGWGLE